MNIHFFRGILVSFLFMQGASAQHKDLLRDTGLISDQQLALLRADYGQNKRYPGNYEKIILYTLSYFPELTENKIEFKVRNSGAPLSSRPAWGTLWRSAGKRKYMVFFHAGTDSAGYGSFFTKAPIPAKIGIIGHELCHVSVFSQKTTIGLLGIGVNHLSTAYMDRFEFKTDSNCIAHGLGYYLMEWASMFDKLFENNKMEDPFKNKNTPTGERYMSAATIEKYIQKSNEKTHTESR